MAFTAYNNLFRDGLLDIWPVPASAGAWVFKDNLLDQAPIAQNSIVSKFMDYNYNGWWPLSGDLLTWWQDNFGYGAAFPYPSPAHGPNDVVLTVALAYQTGPYGNFYLPDTTQLFGAGSRAPADAGLYHYTTRLDQTKEGSEASGHQVNIGLHYIANNVWGHPTDTDADGIPDYVENWHGDGAYASHTDSETDWQNAHTIAGILDPTNAVYDDTDLSGNGLTGLAKRDFHQLAFELVNPLTFEGLGPGVPISGECSIQLNAGGQTNFPGTLMFYVDGQQAETGDVVQNANGSWSTAWDTTTLPNGYHLLQLGYTYMSPNAGNGMGILRTDFSPLIVAAINNPITFYSVSDGFTDVLFINGTLQVPISAYTINIYSDDAAHALLGTINGVPSGGAISASWDFTSQGISVNTGLECAISFPQNPQVTQPIIKKFWYEKGFNGNTFTLAWGWDTGSTTQLANRGTKVQYSLVSMLNTLQGIDLNGNADFDLLPTGLGGNLPFDSAFQLDGSQSAYDRLLASIGDPDSFNFFFWGHGFPRGISFTRLDERKPFGVSSSDIAGALGNPNGSNLSHVYGHSYRFVFLDACGSYSKAMVEAFGIPFSKNSSDATVAQFLQWNRIPRAFVGWDTPVAGSDISCDVCDSYRVAAQQTVLAYWKSGTPLYLAMGAWNTAIYHRQAFSNGKTYDEISPNEIDPSTGKPMGINSPFDTWKISGCKDLTRYSPIP